MYYFFPLFSPEHGRLVQLYTAHVPSISLYTRGQMPIPLLSLVFHCQPKHGPRGTSPSQSQQPAPAAQAEQGEAPSAPQRGNVLSNKQVLISSLGRANKSSTAKPAVGELRLLQRCHFSAHNKRPFDLQKSLLSWLWASVRAHFLTYISEKQNNTSYYHLEFQFLKFHLQTTVMLCIFFLLYSSFLRKFYF